MKTCMYLIVECLSIVYTDFLVWQLNFEYLCNISVNYIFAFSVYRIFLAETLIGIVDSFLKSASRAGYC